MFRVNVIQGDLKHLPGLSCHVRKPLIFKPLMFLQFNGPFGESNALIKKRSALVRRIRGDGKNDLQGHYSFDLLVLRGKTLGFRRDRNRKTFGLVQRLPLGFGRSDDHTRPLFQPRAPCSGRSRLTRCLTILTYCIDKMGVCGRAIS
jgi:hypothetical protein